MNDNREHIPSQLNALINTDPLRGAIHKLRTFRHDSEHGAKLVHKIKRSLAHMMRELSRLEMFNKKVWLKHNMLTDPGWRADVLEDLGGEPALARWDIRRAKADNEVMAPRILRYTPDEDDTPLPDTLKPKRPCFKTDRDGLFRLAPITYTIRKRTVQEDFARWEARSWRSAMRDTPKVYTPRPRPIEEPFRPIPVTPCELRGGTLRRNRSWEQVHAQDAADKQQERDYIHALINSLAPHEIVQKKNKPP